jgi:hypothetical protein
MPSERERGAYGVGKTLSKDVLDRYNPLGLRIQPFKEEKVCGLCESKCDVIFPVGPKLCQRCAMHAIGRTDVMNRWRGKLEINGYRCDFCGSVVYFTMRVNTRVCNKCTIRLGKVTQANQVWQRAGARHVL